MLSVEEAVVRLYSQAKIIAKEVESVSVDQSLGRVVAESIRASIDVPPADNSAMDGYAFCFRDALPDRDGWAVQCTESARNPPESLPQSF